MSLQPIPRKLFHRHVPCGPVTVEVTRYDAPYSYVWDVVVSRGGTVLERHSRLSRQHAELMLREWRESAAELLRKPRSRRPFVSE